MAADAACRESARACTLPPVFAAAGDEDDAQLQPAAAQACADVLAGKCEDDSDGLWRACEFLSAFRDVANRSPALQSGPHFMDACVSRLRKRLPSA